MQKADLEHAVKYAGIFLAAIILLSTYTYADIPQYTCTPSSLLFLNNSVNIQALNDYITCQMAYIKDLVAALNLIATTNSTNTTTPINTIVVNYTGTTINYSTINYTTVNTTTTMNYTPISTNNTTIVPRINTTTIPVNTTLTGNSYITYLINYLLGTFFGAGIQATNLTNGTSTNKTCTNGALISSWPYCDICPDNYVYNGTASKCEEAGYCTSGNGAAAYTNYPWCTNFCPSGSPQHSLYPECIMNTTTQTCTNGGTDYPACDRNDTTQTCLNGGIDYPNCYVGGVSCSTDPEDPNCVCTNGATPGDGNGNCAINVNTHTCIYAGIYPNCSLCPPGQVNIALAPDIECEEPSICTPGYPTPGCIPQCISNLIWVNGSGCVCPQAQSQITDPDTGLPTCQGNCGNNALSSSFPYCNQCPPGQTYDVENYTCEGQQTCQYGGTWPDDCLPCPIGYSYNVSSDKCEFTSACPYGGLYPDCNKCPPGYNYNSTSDSCQGSCQYGGIFPNCNLCKPGYAINPNTDLCEAAVCDYGGTFPNCNAPPSNSCTNGATDADCIRNDTTQTCVNEYSNYPYCADCPPSSIDYPSCLSNKESCDYGGTFPDCNDIITGGGTVNSGEGGDYPACYDMMTEDMIDCCYENYYNDPSSCIFYYLPD